MNHDYNLYWNNTGYPGFPEWGSDYMEANGITAAPHDINADPLFTNAAGGDYSLQPGSPAINNGVTLGAVTKDILNASRPLGHFYDMGAYEFAGPFNYYIDGVAGDDTTGSGTQLRPWKTIQKGADNTAPGDVNVKGGITYTGSTSCGGLGNTVVCLTSSGSAGSYITYQSWVGTGIPKPMRWVSPDGFAVASQN